MPTRRPSPDHQEAVSRRLALLSAELAPEGRTQSPSPDPPPVPVPGRHAARPGRTALAGAVPPTLRGRIALGPAQLAVVAVLVATGLAVTCWWMVRGDAERLEPPAITPATAAATGAGLGPSPVAGGPVAASPERPVNPVSPVSPVSDASVTVDVAGRVRRPGIVVLDAGSRVVDALEAAGGARPGVDLSGLNLARVLVDGEQVLVGVPAPLGVAAAAAPAPGSTSGTLVNLNTATQVELEALPEVGPVTAQAILSWRDEHGGFTAVAELLEVDGIGDATLAQLAPLVTV